MNVPRAFSQNMLPRLQGVFVAVGTRGWIVWKESCSIFTRRGVIREDMGDAAQVAGIPFRHIVKEIARVFCEGGLENLFLSANWEPLGPPVCSILPAPLPIMLGAAPVLRKEVRSKDLRGVRRAKPQPGFGELVRSLVTGDALVAWGKPDSEGALWVFREPCVEEHVDSYD